MCRGPSAIRGLAIAAVVLCSVLLPPALEGQTKAGPAGDRFALFSGALGAVTVNRVLCGVSNVGRQCVDSLGRTSSGGGFWPRGTSNQYIYNSGLQIAGIIGPDGGPWAGDTTGAFFFDPKGTTIHGAALTPIYNSMDPADRNVWPEAARVVGDLYPLGAQGAIAASEGDLWWLMWEGDPSRILGRPHPLGVLVEARAMGWNHPSRNEDVIYFVHTFYNVTSLDPADYAATPPAMRQILLNQAQQFHVLNRTTFGVTLPQNGYTLGEFYVGMASDPDVADAGINYTSVNVPLALGFAWEHTLNGANSRWSYPPELHTPPLFAGTGFVGIKFLQGPDGSDRLQLYSNTESAFGDPQNVAQLYRYLSANVSVEAGDAPCNTGDPLVTHICYVNNSRPFDMRNFQSAPNAPLAPGQFRSLVTAFIFAAPVATPMCGSGSAPARCDIVPGDPTIAGDAARMAAAVPEVERIAGYAGFTDVDGDGRVSQYEYLTVPRSLQGKAQMAQALFDNRFLVPSAPAPPDFFLIPGDDQVTVMWRPSATELTGDPYYQLAKDANRPPPAGGPPVANPLFDPNFRQFDVQGYRIYRGRIDDPDQTEMIAQFDYQGTTIDDYGGQINVNRFCAPELGIVTQCPVVFDSIAPGLARSAHQSIALSYYNYRYNDVIQARFGDRGPLTDGSTIAYRADTLAAPFGTEPPFVFVDTRVRNSFRYYYAVTAFDVNSWQSGPGSMESPRITRTVVPVKSASNYRTSATVTEGIWGRGGLLDHTTPEPALDPATGRFSGPMPPANGWSIALSGFAPEVISGSGSVSARLDSVRLGAPYSDVAHQYWFTGSSGGTPVTLMIPILQPAEIGLTSGSAELPPLAVDRDLAARYGGDGSYALPAAMGISMEGPDYHSLYGRGCVNGRSGFGGDRECAYNGSRWFDGPSPQMNEVMDHPNGGNTANFSGTPMTNYSNAGQLTGVTLIHNTQAYQSVGGGEFRPMEGIKSGARRAADFNVYWGSSGTIDSVIDVTHDVVVPFAADHLGGTWGILNPSESATNPAGSYDQRAEYTNTDFHCVPPVNTMSTGTADCLGAVFTLSRTAVPGPVVPFSPALANAQTAPVFPDPGFGIYLSGDIFTIALAGGVVPAAGRVWSLRTYIGAISGGNGAGGDYGPYRYNENVYYPGVPRSLTAVGSELRVSFDVTQQLLAPTVSSLDDVHPVPDPFYFQSGFEAPEEIRFVNLPEQAVIRIYSASGVLVALVEHNSGTFGGEAVWKVRNRDGSKVAPGVYFFHIESNEARRVGRMLVVQGRR